MYLPEALAVANAFSKSVSQFVASDFEQHSITITININMLVTKYFLIMPFPFRPLLILNYAE